MTKLEEANALREKNSALKNDLIKSENALTEIEANCRHAWLKTEYVPEYHEGYMSPGDPPGTMGVDRRLPCYVPSKTIKRWQRQCGICGKTEITKRAKKICSDEPEF